MYYIYNRKLLMKQLHKHLDYTLIKKSILEMEQTQKELTRKKATLRVRIWRLNQILIQGRQLDLPLEDQQ